MSAPHSLPPNVSPPSGFDSLPPPEQQEAIKAACEAYQSALDSHINPEGISARSLGEYKARRALKAIIERKPIKLRRATDPATTKAVKEWLQSKREKPRPRAVKSYHFQKQTAKQQKGPSHDRTTRNI